MIARLIWSDHHNTRHSDGYFSVYRFCRDNSTDSEAVCEDGQPFKDRMYILDFAGGGVVHLVGKYILQLIQVIIQLLTMYTIGGTAGFILCLFAKFQNYLAAKKSQNTNSESTTIVSTYSPVICYV